MSRIVVGVDGSAPSLAALRYAVQEARLRGGSVDAVTVWHVPSTTYGAGSMPAPLDVAALERAAVETLAEAVAAVAGEAEGVPVRSVVRQGDPAHVLVEESAGAAELVLGCRGHGAVRSVVQRSVSRRCARDARCAVTVVHEGTPLPLGR